MRLEQATTNPLSELALPWHKPIALWPEPSFTPRDGFDKPDTKFVHHKGRCYMLQELPATVAAENYRLLATLAEYGLPVVKPVLVVLNRGENADLPAVLVTAIPQGSMPLASMLAKPEAKQQPGLAQAIAVLTAHLHLAGYHWRVGATPEIIVRRQGNQFDAMLMHPLEGFLSHQPDDLLRAMDLDILAGMLSELQPKSGNFEETIHGVEWVNSVLNHYRQLWGRIADSRCLVEKGEPVVSDLKPPALLATPDETEDQEHHRLALHLLTGLQVTGPRSVQLLNDILRYHCWLEFSSGRKWPRLLAANRWMNEVFLPAIGQLPTLTP